jgi:hypothetical protein
VVASPDAPLDSSIAAGGESATWREGFALLVLSAGGVDWWVVVCRSRTEEENSGRVARRKSQQRQHGVYSPPLVGRTSPQREKWGPLPAHEMRICTQHHAQYA